MKFRAAVLNKVNEPMTLDTLEMAPLSATDVLVRVKASGLSSLLGLDGRQLVVQVM